MSYIGKEYKYDRQENFDGFLRAVGVPEDEIKKLLEFKPSQKLVQNGDSYTYINITPEGKKETTFKSGVEFDDTIKDTIPIKNSYTVEGNTVTQLIKADKGNAIFKREYNGDELVVTITSPVWDGEARRYYKA